MTKNKIYYAHPLDTYGLPEEDKDVEFLEKKGIIVNPSDIELDCSNKMIVYIYIIKDCDTVYYRGTTAGVAFEVLCALAFGKPVFSLETGREITPDQIRELVLSFNSKTFTKKNLELFKKHFPSYYDKLIEIIDSSSSATRMEKYKRI